METIPKDEYDYCIERNLAVAVVAKVPFIGIDYENTDKETAINGRSRVTRDKVSAKPLLHLYFSRALKGIRISDTLAL